MKSRTLFESFNKSPILLSLQMANNCSIRARPFKPHATLNFKLQTLNSLHITNEVEACAAILFACRLADEITVDAENAAFITTLSSRNIFIGHDLMELLETAERHYKEAGSLEALIHTAAGAIRDQTRLPLFYHCLDVILANGLVTPHEHQVVQYLKSKLKIEEEVAWKGMEVLMEKNKL